MSQEKLYSQLIQALTDAEFDNVVIKYLREVDGLTNIYNCNGPYDSGLDVRSASIQSIETQYQITTVEKKFESKLESDLSKAKKNVTEFGLTNKVKYFYSYPLSNDSVLTYRKTAKDKYGLILDLLPGNVIAGVMTQFDELRTFLFEVADLKIDTKANDYFDDSKVKAFYDLMSFGTSTDIKYNIIKSHLINYLYKAGPTAEQSLLSNLNSHFTGAMTASYFESFLSRLVRDQKIVKVNHNIFDLTDGEKQRIKAVLEKYSIEEALLKKQIGDILEEYKMSDIIDEVIIKMSELYESNYAVNLGEFTEKKTTINDLKTATFNFNTFLKGKLIDQEKSALLAKNLLDVADKTEFLSRIAAGSIYTKVSNPDRLQDYITRHINNKDIFLDANVIIHAICVFYEPEADYNRIQFKIAKQLLDFRKKFSLNFKTIKQYEHEVISIFKDALALVPFTKLPIFEQLGGTKNLLFNYYLHLKDWDLLHFDDETFEDFLKEFRFETRRSTPDYHFLPQMDWLLNEMGIAIETPEQYDINLAKQLIVQDQKETHKHKTAFAISNDAIMFMRLGDQDTTTNPIDPIFCTWDMSLLRVRSRFFEEYPNATEWLMYTPTRLMDHFSMMNFQVREGTLSNDVLSILDEDYSFQDKTHSLLDSMLTIVNPQSDVGLAYTNKFAELRKKEIIQIDQKPEPVSDDGSENNYLDHILRKLVINYMQSSDGGFDSFKSVFTKKELIEPVINLFNDEIAFFAINGRISNDLVAKMDSFINESKSFKST